jgi:hypothetical protein
LRLQRYIFFSMLQHFFEKLFKKTEIYAAVYSFVKIMRLS